MMASTTTANFFFLLSSAAPGKLGKMGGEKIWKTTHAKKVGTAVAVNGCCSAREER